MASSGAFSANPDSYAVLVEIGRGGYGQVYKVRDVPGNVYALKRIDLTRLIDMEDPRPMAELCDKALNEVNSMKSLSHNQNIVHLHGHFLGGDFLNISMEFCDEGSLRDAINMKRESGQWFEEPLLITWMIQLVSVLKYCHNKHILHRDIKPENIFLASGGRSVKLGDFGIAKALDSSASHTGTLTGTLPYVPPEIFIQGHYSYKSEVWSLGCVMYELMAHELPFNPAFAVAAITNTTPFRPLQSTRYSAELREYVVDKMLCKNEDDRPTMVDVLTESFVLEGIAGMVSFLAGSSRPVDVVGLLQASQTGDLATVRRILQTTSMEKLHDPKTWQKSSENNYAETPLHRAAANNQVAVLEELWPVMGDALGLAEDVDGLSPIARATLTDAIEAVDFLLAKNIAYLTTVDRKWGRTILHDAAEQGHLELCDKLVNQYGADVFAKSNVDDIERAPIHLAAAFGHLSVIKLFLSLKPVLMWQKDRTGSLAIHTAAYEGHSDLVEYFLKVGRQPVETRGFRGHTVLHCAASNGHAKMCEELVSEYRADAFAKSNTDDREAMPIHLAAEYGHLETVKYFGSLNLELEWQQDGAGNMAIHTAAYGRHTDIVEYLLSDRRLVEVGGFMGRTVLHIAAETGNVEWCEKLVMQNGANVLSKSSHDDQELMAIHVAAALGHLPVVKFFLLLKPELERQKDGMGDMAIHRAALMGQIEVVEFFLTDRLQPVGIRGQWGRTILHHGARNGHVALCEKLIGQYEADVLAKSNRHDQESMAIHVAAAGGHLPVVRALLSVKPELERQRNGMGDMAVHRAAYAGRTEVVEFFLSDRRQAVDVPGQWGQTVLHHAAQKGHVALCEKLVGQYGANVFAKSNSEDQENTPIHLAAGFGHLQVVKLFVSLQPELERQENCIGSTAIQEAAVGGRTEVVEYFLKERGQSVEMRGFNGRTLLHCVAEEGHLELCEQLVSQYEADLFARSSSDDNESMPIHTAAFFGRLPVVKYFLSVKPELEQQSDGTGNKAIHTAALAGQTDVVEYFLKERGQSVETPGFRGRTILHCAAEKGHAGLCEKLVSQYGADMYSKSNRDDREDMPIHLAACFGERAVVGVFIRKDRNMVNAKNRHNETPRQRAKASARDGVVGAAAIATYLKWQKPSRWCWK